MPEIGVVGGGVGGLAGALRLQAAGHNVTLLEQGDHLGGKLNERRISGFSFDTGPSVLTMPWVFDDLLRSTTGRSLEETVQLVRCDPSTAHRFADGSAFAAHPDPARTEQEIERLRPGEGTRWRAFLDHGRRIRTVAESAFLTKPLHGALRRKGEGSNLCDLARIDPLRSLARTAAAHLEDPRLRQWAWRYATYSGSDPRRAPGTLACIPAIEQDGGVWYVRGGLAALRDALVAAAVRLGVVVRTGAEVARITTRSDGRVNGCALTSGEVMPFDAVVATIDAEALYGRIAPSPSALRRLRRAGRSSSGFALLLGLRGRTPGLAHHTDAFCADYAAEFDDLFVHHRRVRDPTVYVSCPAADDDSRAPHGDESWFVLVNAPSEGGIDWRHQASGYAEHILDVLRRRGLDVAGRVAMCEVIHPGDIERRYGSPGGAIYGTSSSGRRAAFLRPPNRGALPGLYLAGGSAHPGGGLPLVALSGAIAARLCDLDLRALR